MYAPHHIGKAPGRRYAPRAMSRPRDRQPTPEDVIGELMLNASRIQALHVAVRLCIPDLLINGPRSSTLLASTTGVHPGALHRLLRFLVADGYFAMTEDGRFALTPNSEALLSTAENGLRGYVLSTATRGWEVWGNLLHSIETGQPAFDRIFGEPYFAEQQRNRETLERFDAALAGGAGETGQALAGAMEPARCVADLGCGSGALLAAVLKAWPGALGIAFDAAEPLELAAKRLAGEKLSERVTLTPGNFLEAAPPGADLYVLSLILHDWDDAACLRILRCCQAAMAPGARLVIADAVLPEDPRTLPQASYADLAMLVMTGGRERTLAEFRSLLEQAGLRFERAVPLGGGRKHTAIEASRGLI